MLEKALSVHIALYGVAWRPRTLCGITTTNVLLSHHFVLVLAKDEVGHINQSPAHPFNLLIISTWNYSSTCSSIPLSVCLSTHPSNYIPNHHSSVHLSFCLSIHCTAVFPPWNPTLGTWQERKEGNGICAYLISSSRCAPCVGDRGEKEPVSPCFVLG